LIAEAARDLPITSPLPTAWEALGYLYRRDVADAWRRTHLVGLQPAVKGGLEVLAETTRTRPANSREAYQFVSAPDISRAYASNATAT
jgi:hypothetical protein